MNKFKLNQLVKIDNSTIGKIVGVPTGPDNKYIVICNEDGTQRISEDRLKAVRSGKGPIETEIMRKG